jgi:3-oxoadipate enol-lactonase
MPVARINGVDLYYRFDGDEGAAETVLFANSLSSDVSMWDAQVPALVDAGYRTLRYDARGHGRSSSPPGPYRIEQLADDPLGLLDQLGLEQVHLCGLSLGGMVAQQIASTYPERLKSVALCATAAYLNPPDVWDQRIAAVSEGGLAVVVDGTIERWFTAAGIGSLPQAVAGVRAGILGTSANGYVACCAAIRDMDQREAIKAIALPVMVLVGEQDPSTTVYHAREIHERIAGSSLVVVPQAQHFVNVEQAQAFNRALLDFLETAA